MDRNVRESTGGKKRPSTRTIDTFFKEIPSKVQKIDQVHSDEEKSTQQDVQIPSTSKSITTSTLQDTQIPSTSKDVSATKPEDPGLENDISLFIGKSINDFTKCRLLETPWTPPENYQFPLSVHQKGGKEERRFVSRAHLSKYPWLVISPSEKGVFCKYCTLFVTGHVGGYQKNVPLQNLVTKPLKSFAKLLGKHGALEIHSKSIYHRQAMEAATTFLRSYHNPEEDVINKVSNQRLNQVKENRERLKPILETILFLGQQNIPLRGHRDEGNVDLSSDTARDSYTNEGNFKELLRFRVKAGDKILKKHLTNAGSNATYISKTTQNDLIACIGHEITSTILQRVKKNILYSVMFDETTDAAHISQLCMILRYIDEGAIREDFIGFTDAYKSVQDFECEDGIEEEDDLEQKLSGENLGTIVLEKLNRLNLNLDDCVGIGTAGCIVMVSEVTGAVQAIQKKAKNAIRCPCYNHALNLSLSKSTSVQSVRNAIGVMKETIYFFRASAKRNLILKNELGGQMSGLCETRWVERHTTVLQFRADLEKIVRALKVISKWKELDTASKANSLISSVCESEFIISIVCLSDILSITLPLSRYLQKEEVNLDRAVAFVQSTLNCLEEKRAKCEEQFTKLLEDCRKVADNLDIDIQMPRIVGRQKHRSNPPVAEANSYFRISIYIPLLESVTQDLRARFSQETLQVYGLTNLIPRIALANESSEEDMNRNLKECVSKFSNVLGTDEATAHLQIESEYKIWQGKTNVPKNAINSFNECDKDVFPLIKRLLQYILSVLPASVASAERSFSTLRRLKTWLRSRMGEERLTGLALMSTHRDVEVDLDKVIDRFAKSANRRLDFVFMFTLQYL